MPTDLRSPLSPTAVSADPALHVDTLLPAVFLALGTFAIGTEGFMIAPMLATIASDFGMQVPHAALLVVIFTLTLAISSPIAAVLTARMKRRATLLFAMAVFAIGNLLAAWSPSFEVLMAARILMAIASGLYVPTANALAGAIVSPLKRGRALAIVSGGMTLAIALGLPFGGLVGHAFGWRATFVAVSLMSLAAIAGIGKGIARDAGENIPVATIAQRLAVTRQPSMLRLLFISFLWSIGAYTAYPFIGPYLTQVVGFGIVGINATVSMWGLAAALGVTVGGMLNDKFGSDRVVRMSLLVLGLAFWTLSFSAAGLSPKIALVPVLAATAVWGFTVWSFFPPQVARLIAAGNQSQAPISLALNTSTMYLGFSVGSAMGAATLGSGKIWGIGLIAGAFQMAALLVDRRSSPEAERADNSR